jgi:hypothetical protein
MSRTGEKKEMVVAKVIEFRVPDNFRRRVKWVPLEQRGKVIEFAGESSLAAPVGPGAYQGDFLGKPALER